MNARDIHDDAAKARENGDFLEALKLSDEALIAYQNEADKLGFAEIQSERFLILRHLFEKTSNRQYLILAKYAAKTSVKLAEESNKKEALAIPYFNLAKALESLGKLDKAIENYQLAYENITKNPPETHNRKAIIADIKIHLETAKLKRGDQSALEETLSALQDLEQSDEDLYNKNVWISGAHMRIADALREKDLEKAKEYIKKAKEIIDSDSRLKLRLLQWQKLSESF